MSPKSCIFAAMCGATLLASQVVTSSFAQKGVTLDPTPEQATLVLNTDNTSTIKEVHDESLAAASSSRIDYSRLSSTPRSSRINPGRTSPKAKFMKGVLGTPGALTTNCSSVTNSRLRKRMVTESVGPFRVTGLKPAVNELKVIFSRVKREKPALYSQLGSAGMLCVRKVRGGSNFSNHSWGTAIDLRINGKLDQPGDNKTQLGLKQLYPYFHAQGFYWGAEFGNEDSMHFEASQELISKWKRQGKI